MFYFNFLSSLWSSTFTTLHIVHSAKSRVRLINMRSWSQFSSPKVGTISSTQCFHKPYYTLVTAIEFISTIRCASAIIGNRYFCKCVGNLELWLQGNNIAQDMNRAEVISWKNNIAIIVQDCRKQLYSIKSYPKSLPVTGWKSLRDLSPSPGYAHRLHLSDKFLEWNSYSKWELNAPKLNPMLKNCDVMTIVTKLWADPIVNWIAIIPK